MAAKKEKRKIKSVSYIHVGTWGNIVPLKDLTPEEQCRAATEISKKFLNTFYAGIAVFYEEGETPPM